MSKYCCLQWAVLRRFSHWYPDDSHTFWIHWYNTISLNNGGTVCSMKWGRERGEAVADWFDFNEGVCSFGQAWEDTLYVISRALPRQVIHAQAGTLMVYTEWMTDQSHTQPGELETQDWTGLAWSMICVWRYAYVCMVLFYVKMQPTAPHSSVKYCTTELPFQPCMS